MFWKRSRKPELDKVRKGKQLQYAVEMSSVESFEILINRKVRYPDKLYAGRFAKVFFQTDDVIYWGFPKLGF